MASSSNDLYEFGPCRLDVGQRLLTRQDQRVSLAPKTFDLLLLLVQNPGRAFSKQELLTTLWPDTFVEEGNLAFQISTLRKALGEGVAEWIETVPKHGYRFSGAVIPSSRAAPPWTPPHQEPGANILSPGTAWRLVVAFVVAILAVVMYLLLVRGRPSPPTRERISTIAAPLTAYPGVETAPSLSPDGSQVAFVWDGPRQDNHDIYVKLVGPGEPIRLTTGPERDISPAWSPDGRRIAFVRVTTDGVGDVFVMPALGGAQRRVATVRIGNAITQRWCTLSWSPDGNWIAIGGRLSPADPFSIWLMEVDGPGRRRLTTPQTEGWLVDVGPVFSPDGRRIAFVRAKASNGALFVLPLSPALAPAGKPVPVTNDPRKQVVGLAWTTDSRSLIYSWGGHVAPTRLERIAISERSVPIGQPELLPFGERATAISIGRTGRLVYSAELRDTNFWKLDLTRPGSVPEEAGLSSSTLDETTPDYSPDGTQVIFASTRSGSEELWLSNIDGSGLRQMTSMAGPLCANPDWSPDGQTILFNSTREGSNDLFLLSPASGELRRLTTDPEEELEALWSRDAQWIYFSSNRTGRMEIWKMRADGGGTAMQVTRNGGADAQESPDRRFLYYTRDAKTPTVIWRMPIAGGEEVQVVDGLSYPRNYVVSDRGIYFVAVGHALSRTSIDFFDFRSARRTTLAALGKGWWFGVALSPDQQWLLFPTIDREGRDLMFVDPSPDAR